MFEAIQEIIEQDNPYRWVLTFEIGKLVWLKRIKEDENGNVPVPVTYSVELNGSIASVLAGLQEHFNLKGLINE